MLKLTNLIILFSLLFCSKKSVNISENSNFIIDSLDVSDIRQVQESSNNQELIILRKKTPSFLIYNVNNQNTISNRSFTLWNDSLYDKKYNFYFHSYDSIFLIPESTNELYLLNLKSGSLKSVFYSLSNFDFNDNFTFSASFCPIRKVGNNIYVQTIRTDISVRTDSERELYYRTKPDMAISIQKPFETKLTAQWPEEFNGKMNYRDYYIYSALNTHTKDLVYGFRSVGKLLKLNEENKISKKNITSRYHSDPKIYPNDSVGNFAFLKRYIIEEPRYDKILYNKFYNLYFRIYIHRINFYNEDGYLNEFEDKPFSLIVFDENLNFLNEFIFDQKKYLYYHCFTKDDKIYLLNRENKPNSVTYSAFKIVYK